MPNSHLKMAKNNIFLFSFYFFNCVHPSKHFSNLYIKSLKLIIVLSYKRRQSIYLQYKCFKYEITFYVPKKGTLATLGTEITMFFLKHCFVEKFPFTSKVRQENKKKLHG